MVRLPGAARFSGTYNVPSSKRTSPVSGVVNDAGSMTTSPAFRQAAGGGAPGGGSWPTASSLGCPTNADTPRATKKVASNPSFVFMAPLPRFEEEALFLLTLTNPVQGQLPARGGLLEDLRAVGCRPGLRGARAPAGGAVHPPAL